MRVPIHAIAGTSMGAVVGGLYAAGMSPNELEELVTSVDWADAFKDAPSRENLSYRHKQDDAAFPMRLELGLRDGELQIPKGLIQGQKLALILRNNTVGVAHIDDFDRLPVPFRAVASNIVTGETQIMKGGDLVLAMRASMSAPGIFAPVVVNGNALVDGGLGGNVPVHAIKEMCVDVIIAVDVEFPLYRTDQIHSALDITAQMLTILIRKETRRQLEDLAEGDVLIRPDLGDFGSTDFTEIVRAIEPGAIAAAQHSSELSRLAVDEDTFRAYLDRRRVDASPGDRIEFVRFEDDSRLSERVLASRLESARGDEVDAGRLSKDAARLYGLQLYEQVDYRLINEGDSTGVEFTTRTKTWGPNFLRFGMLLQDDFEGRTSFNVSSRLTRAGINHLGAEWRSDLQLGTEPSVFSEFYQPLSADSRTFVAPHVALEQDNFNVFDGNASVARYRVGEAEIGLDFGYELGLWGEMRLGTFRGTGEAKRKTGAPELANIDFETGGLHASFNVDTRDNAKIPLHGSRARVQWLMSRPGLGADSDYHSVESSVSGFWTSGRHTLNAGISFNTTANADNLVQNFFPMGGFLNLSGLQRGEISGPHSGVARLVYYRRSGAMAKELFGMPLYFGASLEAGNVWKSRSEIGTDSLILNGSLFAAVDSYLGPVFLAAGFGEGSSSSFYLILGPQN